MTAQNEVKIQLFIIMVLSSAGGSENDPVRAGGRKTTLITIFRDRSSVFCYHHSKLHASGRHITFPLSGPELINFRFFLHVDVQNANIILRFLDKRRSLKRFLLATYEDEIYARHWRDIIVPPLNARKIHYICQGSSIMKTVIIIAKSIMYLIASTYCLVDGRGACVVRFENWCRKWRKDLSRSGQRRVTQCDLKNSIQHLKLPNIILFTPTSNAGDVLEERLQRVCPVFNETTNQLVIKSSVYRRVLHENDTAFRKQLWQIRDSLLPACCIYNFDNGKAICTLGSVQCDFPLRDTVQEWQDIIPYQYVFMQEASQVQNRTSFHFSTALGLSASLTNKMVKHFLYRRSVSAFSTHKRTATAFL